MRYFLSLIVALVLLTGCERNVEQPDAMLEGAPQEEAVANPASTPPPLFEDVMAFAHAQELHEKPLGDVMQAIGLQFIGKPYVAGVLDQTATETLVCRVDGFDCVTFLETALAMARGIKAEDYSYETFQRHIEGQRYRGGEMEDYCSRLHYFSDWIADNDRRGVVENITAEIGGVPLEKQLDFMSTHRSSYPRFAEDDEVYACIQRMESDLRNVDLFYVPENRIRSVYSQLQAGDIVATATDIEGLDVTHTGLVHDNGDGTMGLLHASTSGGVKVSPDLQSYLEGNKSQIGIIVARPKG